MEVLKLKITLNQYVMKAINQSFETRDNIKENSILLKNKMNIDSKDEKIKNWI